MREPNQIPELPVLVSSTFPPGHRFPYENATPIEEAVWYWGVLRFKQRQLDWYFDVASFKVASNKMGDLITVVGLDRIKTYTQWFMDENGFAASTNWDFNCFTSSHMINKFLGNESSDEDMSWYRHYVQDLDALQGPLAKEVPTKIKEIRKSKAARIDEAKAEEAARLGTDPNSVKIPFEK